MTAGRRYRLVLAALAALAAGPARAATVTVDVGGVYIAFLPSTVTIQVGDTVTWINRGGDHNVVADDGSFSSGSPSAGDWVYSHTFNAPGSFPYVCEVHESLGMVGTVIVQSGGGGGTPGALRFLSTAVSVSEAAGNATLTVQRINGDDGAVSVQYSTAPGTAAAGPDYPVTTGTLSWADGNDDPRTLSVPIVNDAAAEPNESFTVHLAGPTGGATLVDAAKTATVTIQDNDAPAGSPPAAPSGLVAMAHTTSEIMLAWNDNSGNESEFRIERKTLRGAFQQVATVPANVDSFVAGGLDEATHYTFRVRAANAGGVSAFSNEAAESTLATVAPCVPGPTVLCLGAGDRFRITAVWRHATDSGQGQMVPIPTAEDSGLFYFFGDGANIEGLVKVPNACGFPGAARYWFFLAATTNVEFEVVVTDTHNGRTRNYFNPLNRPAPPVQDTDAFATCP